MLRATKVTVLLASLAACSSGKGDAQSADAAPGGGADAAQEIPDGGPGADSAPPATQLYAGPCTEEVDFDGDGMAELGAVHTYNENDLVTTIEDDFMMDGSLERRQTFTYNENGDVLVYEDNFDFPDPLDAEPNLRETYEYGDDGKLGVRNVDQGADDVIDRVVTFEYNADDLLNEVTIDDGNDGSPDRIEQYTYDADGNRITEEIDTNADGEVDGIFTSTYENGLRTRRELDILSVGDPDSIEQVQTWTYDADGNATKQEWDANNDTMIDQVISREFDMPGNLLRSERDGIDSQGMGTPPDGSPDFATTFGYACWTAKARRAPERRWPQIGGVLAPTRGVYELPGLSERSNDYR